ncbi:unnamed protein product [Paramecium sonneborni]|uniref:Uncharacterized protein n=1 Tax=Paramecium sonneborni TaxID=65129 RepID=A0A8S1NKM9_9CILI|nr:unnamed protein product [Paramecium sonneborni]
MTINRNFNLVIIIISNLYEPKIFQSASLPKKNFTNRDNSSRQYKNLKSLSIETPQIEQKKPKLRSFIGILIKNKLIQNSKQKDLSIQSREKNINLKQGMRNTSVQSYQYTLQQVRAPNRSLQRLITQFLYGRIKTAQIRNSKFCNFTSCQLISKQE